MGPSPLTAAEIRFLPYLQTHLTLAAIAERLFVSRTTVRSEVTSIYRKLGACSRQEAVDRAELSDCSRAGPESYSRRSSRCLECGSVCSEVPGTPPRRREGLLLSAQNDSLRECHSRTNSGRSREWRAIWRKRVVLELPPPTSEDEEKCFRGWTRTQFSETSNVVPIESASPRDRARSAYDPEVEDEVLELPPLTSENGEKCSGGETRTHNLAVNSRLLCH